MFKTITGPITGVLRSFGKIKRWFFRIRVSSDNKIRVSSDNKIKVYKEKK